MRAIGPSRAYLVACFLTSLLIALYLAVVLPPLPTGKWVDYFHSLFFLQEPAAVVLCLAILGLALAPSVRKTGTALVAWVGVNPGKASLAFFLLTAAGTLLVYRNYPLSPDEYVARFQSEAFAAGRLTGRMPVELLDWLVPRQRLFFPTSHTTGEVVSGYWPGHSLLLAPFTALGLPWVLNPLVGAGTVLLVHKVALELFQDRWLAGLAAGLTMASTAVTVNAISYYSMPAHLALNLGWTILVLRPSASRMLAAGLVGSLALVLHNPVPHLLYAAPWGVWILWRREHRRLVPWLAAGYLPGLFVGLAWAGLQARVGAGGFDPEWGAGKDATSFWQGRAGRVFGLPTAEILEARLLGLIKLWLWAVPGLPILAVFGLRYLRRNPAMALLAASAVTTLVGYLFVPASQGYGWGYRYFHSAWATLPLLGLGLIAAERAPYPGDARSRSILPGYVAGKVLLSVVLATTLRFVQVADYVGFRLRQAPSATSGVPQLVLIDTSIGYSTMDLVQNHPLLRRRPIYMESLGPERDHAMIRSRFPDLSLLHADKRGEVWGIP